MVSIVPIRFYPARGELDVVIRRIENFRISYHFRWLTLWKLNCHQNLISKGLGFEGTPKFAIAQVSYCDESILSWL